MNVEHMRTAATSACTLMKVLANQDRLMLLCQLVENEKCVGDLETATGIKQPTLSQQLTVLREEQLVRTRRNGKHIFYRLSSAEALTMMQALYNLYCGDKVVEANLDTVE